MHTKVSKYFEIVKDNDESIQVGDFGFKTSHDWFINNMDSNKHKIVFGNHDYYLYLDKPHSLKDWSYYKDIFTIRGADSIDMYKRTEGLDYFNNEQLNYSEFDEVIYNYERIKPDVVISHDCPYKVSMYLFGYEDKTCTKNGLLALFEIHQPKIWLFGHYHSKRDEIIEGTRFICLKELEVFNL